MKIRDAMVREVRSCTPDTSLAVAGAMMSELGVGALPVVDGGRKVVGMITDRDLGLALALRNVRASELVVRQAMSSFAHACRPQDEVALALKIMATYKVRRLPVTDDDDHLEGMLSIDDLLSVVGSGEGTPSSGQIVEAFRAISEPYFKRTEKTSRPG